VRYEIAPSHELIGNPPWHAIAVGSARSSSRLNVALSRAFSEGAQPRINTSTRRGPDELNDLHETRSSKTSSPPKRS
jgi:hypothetical protein